MGAFFFFVISLKMHRSPGKLNVRHSPYALSKTLKEFGVFESQADLEKREKVLEDLNQIVKHWICSTSVAQGIPEERAKTISGGNTIYTFGSYRLGVHNPGSDIDTLCIGPRNIRRETFYDELGSILKQHPEVTDLNVVRDAFVPVITFNFSSVNIDMVYCQLPQLVIPTEFNLLSD